VLWGTKFLLWHEVEIILNPEIELELERELRVSTSSLSLLICVLLCDVTCCVVLCWDVGGVGGAVACGVYNTRSETFLFVCCFYRSLLLFFLVLLVVSCYCYYCWYQRKVLTRAFLKFCFVFCCCFRFGICFSIWFLFLTIWDICVQTIYFVIMPKSVLFLWPSASKNRNSEIDL